MALDSNVITQEKLAAAQDVMVREVFVPAFVTLYNEKIAKAGLGKTHSIRTEDDLRTAMGLADNIMQKEAQARVAQGSPFAKAAQALSKLDGVNNRQSDFVRAATALPAVKEAVALLAKAK